MKLLPTTLNYKSFNICQNLRFFEAVEVSPDRPNGRYTDVPKLLVIDNYDSFTYNLVQMFTFYDLDIIVKRSDKITIEQVKKTNPDYILISPGPKDPAHAGISINLIKEFYDKKPILGVCLGMQCINEAFGGETVRAPVPVHGKTSLIYHGNEKIFHDMPCPFSAARYHSLMVKLKPLSQDIIPLAWTQENIIMGIQLKNFNVFGVQFHPESFLTEKGGILIENFLKTGSILKLSGSRENITSEEL